MTSRAVGDRFEQIACAHLQKNGLRLIERNASSRHGELDLIMLDHDQLVFVEVRYRRDPRAGDGIDSIGPNKRTRLIHAASLWLAAHPEHGRRACRFDVVALAGGADAPTLDWLRNAFDAF